jgi:hypothetical protein
MMPNKLKKTHYTYVVYTDEDISTRLMYIGVRSCFGDPVRDTQYMGSSKLVNFMLSQGIKFKKDILNTYKTRDEAEQAEQDFFDEFNCSIEPYFINLHSHNCCYTAERAAIKMEYFKSLFPQLNVTDRQRINIAISERNKNYVDGFKKITLEDLVFRVALIYSGRGSEAWVFLNHPENIKHYYPSTGTITYWPGRDDMLMSDNQKKGKIYYQTKIELDGTPKECVEDLINNHYVKGQKIPILEYTQEYFKLMDPKTYAETIAWVKTNIDRDDLWVLSRIDKIYNHQVLEQAKQNFVVEV